MKLATTLFAILVTIYGLSVTASPSRAGDITYRIAVFVILVVSAGLLILPVGRHGLSG